MQFLGFWVKQKTEPCLIMLGLTPGSLNGATFLPTQHPKHPKQPVRYFLDCLMLGNHWLRKSNLLFSWSAWTTVQVSQCPSFGIFLRYIGKMDYLAPRAEKRLSWAFEANRRQIHVFYGVIVSGLTPGSWDWATYLSAKWSTEDQDSLDCPLLYRRYTAEK